MINVTNKEDQKRSAEYQKSSYNEAYSKEPEFTDKKADYRTDWYKKQGDFPGEYFKEYIEEFYPNLTKSEHPFRIFGAGCGSDDTIGILLYRSHAQGCRSERSDIDICIVAPGNDYVLMRINRRLGGKYDVKVFEKMPLYIQIEIIRNHLIIYGDAAWIGAYFYRFGRLWADMEPRIRDNRFSSAGERMALRRGWMREKRTIPGEIGSF